MKQQSKYPRTVFFDIETAPNVGYAWGTFEQNIIEVIKSRYILGFAYKVLGEKKVHTHYVHDYKGRVDTDKNLMPDLWKMLDEADIIVAHYGDKFDLPWVNTQLIIHGYTPPSPYKSIDTKREAGKFYFNSNKLGELCKALDLDWKSSPGGFETWKKCMAGEKKALEKMRKYNKNDVVILEELYLRLRPWMKNHPNVNVYLKENGCPSCGSKHVQSRGESTPTKVGVAQRYQCVDCGAWSHGPYKTVKEVVLR